MVSVFAAYPVVGFQAPFFAAASLSASVAACVCVCKASGQAGLPKTVLESLSESGLGVSTEILQRALRKAAAAEAFTIESVFLLGHARWLM